MNYREARGPAQAIIRRLCQGAQIDGIRFGPILQILITDRAATSPRVRGQTYLSLGSRWKVFEDRPASWPDGEHQLSLPSLDERLGTLCELRESTITEAELGERQPHLILHLGSGRVLFVNGRHDEYECWQLGVALGDPNEHWMVVACPGGEVAVWAPQEVAAG
jgi:hypothetical protein